MTRRYAIDPRTIKILSGGQTGVDRAVLDAALAAGIACGGWCPRGRRAEDGPIDERYPLRETESDDYAVRTQHNVADADATVIIYFGHPRGGTEQTLKDCLQLEKPYLLLDADEIPPDRAARRMAAFFAATGARVINSGGPRASAAPLGTQIAWNNPESGHSGTVTPIREGHTSSGRYCREYQQTVTVGGRVKEAYGTACRQPDGSWQFVQ